MRIYLIKNKYILANDSLSLEEALSYSKLKSFYDLLIVTDSGQKTVVRKSIYLRSYISFPAWLKSK